MSTIEQPFAFLLIAMLPVLAETAVYWLRPAWLASVALLPLGVVRRIALPEAAPQPDPRAGYRQPGMVDQVLTEVSWPEHFESDQAVGGFDHGGNFTWVRLRMHNRRPAATARIATRVEGSDLHLEAYWLPSPLTIVVPAVVAASGGMSSLGVWFAFAIMAPIMLVISGLMGRARLRPEVEHAMDEIERAVTSYRP